MTRDEWLAQIDAKPGDWQMALIAADEIESDGDELFAEQLRFAVQWCFSAGLSLWHVILRGGWMQKTLMQERAEWRQRERRWCERTNVRFIPAFPRSLDDVYEGRELV